MDSKNAKTDDLANRMHSKLSMQCDNSEDEKAKSEDDDSEWETQSSSESDWGNISESDWSIGGDTVSGSDSNDERPKKDPLCFVTSPSLKVWGDEIVPANVCAFKLKPGLKESCGKTPVDYFKLLFKRSLFEFLVNNINNYAMKVAQGQRRIKEVTLNEFNVFFGLFLNIGTLNTNVINDFWRTEPLVENPEEYMSAGRFGNLLKLLNFEHAVPGNQDKMSKISHMIDYFNVMMKKVVNPEKILCIEECVPVPCHEHVYLLTDEFGLAHKMVVYPKDEKAGPHVAKTLLDDKLDVGHSVYMDDDYNTLELTKYLIDRNTHVTGPLKRQRIGNLEAFKKHLKKCEKITKYNSDGICLTKYKDKREINNVMVSTEHSADWVEYVNKVKWTIKKPKCKLEYNKYKNSIEKHNEMMGYYYIQCGDKANRYKRIGVHILQMLVLNAHILYNRYGGQPMPLVEFRRLVTKYLLSHGKRY